MENGVEIEVVWLKMKEGSFIPIADPDLGGNEIEYVVDCVKSNWIGSLGEYITKFENKFSDYCKVRHSVSTFNGTVALHLALVALGIKPGDEIIVPDLTFVATANAGSYIGAKQVLVDVDKKNWTIDVNQIKKSITKKTKAIIPVHLYGHPCDMDPIMEIARKYNLFVVEDVAQAIGAEYKGKKTGSIGDISCFSFYGNKILITGEGGMCTTNNDELAERMAFLKNHAMSNEKKYWHTEIGFNYRMTNIQAAIGLAQLERVDKFIEIKRKNAKIYNKLLSDVRGIEFPVEEKWAKNVYWMYSILTNKREELSKALKNKNVDSRPFFYPLHTMPPYLKKGICPISEELSPKGLSLPSSTKLSEDQIKYVCKVISDIEKK